MPGLGHFPIYRASLSRRSTVPTLKRITTNISALCTVCALLRREEAVEVLFIFFFALAMPILWPFLHEMKISCAVGRPFVPAQNAVHLSNNRSILFLLRQLAQTLSGVLQHTQANRYIDTYTSAGITFFRNRRGKVLACGLARPKTVAPWSLRSNRAPKVGPR